MGGVHLSAIEEIPEATVAAVSSRTRPGADAPSRGNLPGVKSAALPANLQWYDNWKELVADQALDAVDICLPTQLHEEVAVAALGRGKHVLCEKPLALTSAACDRILQAAALSGRVFMVAQVLRFMFPYQYAASFARSLGADGVTSCTLRRKAGYPQWSEWLANEKNSGGAILDLLSHDLDQALRVFGRPETVSATSLGEVDTMLGVLRYPSGLEVTIEGGWFPPGLPFSASFEITGKDAALTFAEGKLLLTRDGREQAVVVPEHHEYRDQLSYFLDCCRTNTAPELCLPTESAEAVRVANLLRTSREQNGRELSCER